MPEIKPFRAYTYGATHQKSIKALVCPPYDVISPDQRETLMNRNPLNFVRVELPTGDPSTRYTAARALWDRWTDQGVLKREANAAFYVYEARFRSPLDGRPLRRRGFFAALKAVPWGQGVYPHEKTLPTHKADRLQLFKALWAQTSPIQLLARDGDGRIDRLIAAHQKGAPWIQFTDEARVAHRFWKWSADAQAEEMARLFQDTPCAIADGHHRYETSLAYGRWAKRKWGAASPASAYVMAYFSSSGDAGLEVLPTHRAVSWEKRQFVKLAGWGRLKPVTGLRDLKALMDGKKGPGLREVGVYREGKYFIYQFTKTPPELLKRPHAQLPVACLHAGPLKGLGKEDFFFTRTPEEAVEEAGKHNGWAFLLAPNTVNEVLDVSTAGLVMPPKSTYFYPKIPSGILSHSLHGAF